MAPASSDATIAIAARCFIFSALPPLSALLDPIDHLGAPDKVVMPFARLFGETVVADFWFLARL